MSDNSTCCGYYLMFDENGQSYWSFADKPHKAVSGTREKMRLQQHFASYLKREKMLLERVRKMLRGDLSYDSLAIAKHLIDDELDCNSQTIGNLEELKCS